MQFSGDFVIYGISRVIFVRLLNWRTITSKHNMGPLRRNISVSYHIQKTKLVYLKTSRIAGNQESRVTERGKKGTLVYELLLSFCWNEYGVQTCKTSRLAPAVFVVQIIIEAADFLMADEESRGVRVYTTNTQRDHWASRKKTDSFF